MNSFKRTMTAVGTAVVIAAVGALAAPAAHAAPGVAPAALTADPETKSVPATVEDASIRHQMNGQFHVEVERKDGSNPNLARVEVRRAGTVKVLAVVDRFTDNYDNKGTSERWDDRSWWQGDAQPLVLDEMGDYELDVYDKNGGVRRNAGRSTYAEQAQVEVKSSRQEFSLDALDTQVTGSVTAVHPRTGERLPLTGARLRARLGKGWADGVSDAQGRFSFSVSALGNEPSMYLSVDLASGYTKVSGYAPAKIRSQQAILTLTSTAPLTARYGTAVPVLGKLNRVADDGTVKPAAGQRVVADGIARAEATTGPDGTYTLLPRVFKTGSVDVYVPGGGSWVVGGGTRTATVGKITHTTKVVEEKLVATDKYGGLTFSGKVLVDGITGQQAPIQIQFQYAPGKWATRQSFTVPYNKTFTVKVTTPSSKYPSDGWRVYTPGTSNIGPSTGTKVLRQTRAQTQLTGERFGPRPVAKGQQLYVAAVLDKYTNTEGFVPYAGQKVRYYFRPDGSTVWKEMGTSVSGANGAVSKKFTAQTSGHWRIRFVDADATHLASFSQEGRIEVKG
ncbi:hypothetical protein M8Z33_18030 [Streptomyces sp. ZAF1911]|uniref:hypothetical protein n=1 Tax=Streptomyces sp. ZAF1911 TaxID=2944129 RepID=UPI00237AF4A0|nr:hypothetical protein [Streptomyces sp. ZAF1911]MDD9378520.1 hypothetical protein [Streptomyces sp. ZAF1911]